MKMKRLIALAVIAVIILNLIPGCVPVQAKQTAEVKATLDGADWPSSGTGAVNYKLTGPGPASPISGTEVPASFSVNPGNWACAYVSGGPAGAYLVDITPSGPQSVAQNATITFTLNFKTIIPGTIEIKATLDGADWPSSGTGSVDYTLTGPGPASPISGTAVPASFSVYPGNWTCAYVFGGPAGAYLVDITPSGYQSVAPNATITFTLNFKTIIPGTIEVKATLDGADWPSSGTGAVNYKLTGSGPASPISGTEVPASFSVYPGNWACAYVSGGPAGAYLVDITPSGSQSVAPNATITFTLNFETTLPHSAFDGRLFSSLMVDSPAAEYEDVTAFPYKNLSSTLYAYVHIESNEGRKDLVTNIFSDNLGNSFILLTDRQTLWIAYSYAYSIVVNKYTIGESSLILVSSTAFGDSHSRPKGFIRLASGKLLLAWAQNERVDDTCVFSFAYTDSGETWHQFTDTLLCTYIASPRTSMCQHPDGTIWLFADFDSEHVIRVIHFVENGESISVDWKDNAFIPAYDGTIIGDEISADTEQPLPVSIASPTRSAIILAYTRHKGLIYAGNYIWTAQIAVIAIHSDASKEYLFYLDDYTYSVQPFLMGINERDEIWLAYGKVDWVEQTNNDLYLGDVYLGELYGQYPGEPTLLIKHSSKFVIASMSDNKIHFYDVSQHECSDKYVKVVSPTGDNGSSQWKNRPNAYDGIEWTHTYANVGADQWSEYLELTHSEILCNAVAILNPTNFVAERIDVYYEGDWHNIFDGLITTQGWNTFSIPAGAKNVTGVRFQGKKSGTAGNVYVYEVLLVNVLPNF
jgi:hypothetical protein